MNQNFKSSSQFLKELELQLRTHQEKTGETIIRLRKKVAFDRFLARIFSQESSPFFLKGGYSMELRILEARATKDMDLTCFRRNFTDEPAVEQLWQNLQVFARINLNDHFVYHIGRPQDEIENAPYGGSRHSVSTFIDNKPFVDFHLDIGNDFLIGETEKIIGTHWLDFCGITPPVISVISVEQQFAEKLHSYTLARDHTNTRAKDLIDMLLLLKANNRAIETFRVVVQRVFAARNTHRLPTSLPEPPPSWKNSFAAMAQECGISQNLNEGFLKISDFYSDLKTE